MSCKTALNDFLHCSLRFYYKQIAGIREPDEEKTELSPDVFGRVFHTSMQLLYADHDLLDKELLKNLESKIDNKVEEALAEVFKRKVTGGNDYLLLQIIKELVRKVLLCRGGSLRSRCRLGQHARATASLGGTSFGQSRLYTGKVCDAL